MVANPSNWSWSELENVESEPWSLGRVERNYPLVRSGDLVVGYESKPSKRIVALARVIGEYDPDGDPESALQLEPLSRVSDGPTGSSCKTIPCWPTANPSATAARGPCSR